MYADVEARMGAGYVVCVPAERVVDDDPPCSDNTVMYLFTCMQYSMCCLCLSIGKPFRKPFYSNPFYLVSIVLMTAYQTYVIAYQDSWDTSTFALLALPKSYIIWILIMVAANSLCSYLFEKLVIGAFARYWNNKYKKLSSRSPAALGKDASLATPAEAAGTPDICGYQQ